MPDAPYTLPDLEGEALYALRRDLIDAPDRAAWRQLCGLPAWTPYQARQQQVPGPVPLDAQAPRSTSAGGI